MQRCDGYENHCQHADQTKGSILIWIQIGLTEFFVHVELMLAH